MGNLAVVETAVLEGAIGEIKANATIIQTGTVKSMFVESMGKKLYIAIGFTVTVNEFTGSGILLGNSEKTKLSNLSVVMDNATTNVLGSNGSATTTIKVTVKNAGQNVLEIK